MNSGVTAPNSIIPIFIFVLKNINNINDTDRYNTIRASVIQETSIACLLKPRI